MEPAAVAELQRLRDVEEQFKRPQMEHDPPKKAIPFASDLERNLRLHRGKLGPFK